MRRSMMQVYVKNSAEAAELYREAFNASFSADYRHPDGSCAHTELNADGQILAVSEAEGELIIGNSMQFCLHFDENERYKVDRAYDVLKEGAKIVCPIGECPYSRRMFALIDRFGIYWCVFN